MALFKAAAKVSRLPPCLLQTGDQKASGGLRLLSTALSWSCSDWPHLSPGKLIRPLSVGAGSSPEGFTPVLALIFSTSLGRHHLTGMHKPWESLVQGEVRSRHPPQEARSPGRQCRGKTPTPAPRPADRPAVSALASLQSLPEGFLVPF